VSFLTSGAPSASYVANSAAALGFRAIHNGLGKPRQIFPAPGQVVAPVEDVGFPIIARASQAIGQNRPQTARQLAFIAIEQPDAMAGDAPSPPIQPDVRIIGEPHVLQIEATELHLPEHSRREIDISHLERGRTIRQIPPVKQHAGHGARETTPIESALAELHPRDLCPSEVTALLQRPLRNPHPEVSTREIDPVPLIAAARMPRSDCRIPQIGLDEAAI